MPKQLIHLCHTQFNSDFIQHFAGYAGLCNRHPPHRTEWPRQLDRRFDVAHKATHTLKNEVGFTSRQSTLLFSDTTERDRSALWMGRNMRTPTFCDELHLSQVFCVFHFWVSRSADIYVLAQWTRMPIASRESILWIYKRPTTYFL